MRLARTSGRRLPVRLVKGAYWDTEIKRCQEVGLAEYPVFTRKCHTDVSYEVCAARLLVAGDAIWPQFATHNAQTVCTILALADPEADFEFQRLHGMGELLYRELARTATSPASVRVYAPVGSHRDLLPYLVRRLLENGANQSFVNRLLDARTPVRKLVTDVLDTVEGEPMRRHPQVPVPRDLVRAQNECRTLAAGFDLDDPLQVDTVLLQACAAAGRTHQAGPIVGGKRRAGVALRLFSPADRSRVIGRVMHANQDDIESAIARAVGAQPAWNRVGGEARANVLEAAGALLETKRCVLAGLIVSEAGRTVADALDEVREAVDFCRYYALQARLRCAGPTALPGPTGEENRLSLHGRGVFACISPWNFPLAICVGQVTAALAAGNTVIAKPAEQTPFTAAAAIEVLLDAGIPPDAVHLLPGAGDEVGGAIVADGRISGVAFTGSSATARRINERLARRAGAIVPLIAETGGQNAMIVDSTALPEQVVDDVIRSAFGSAGQRCSALRILYLQEEVADRVLEMLAGAMSLLRVGDPLRLETDVGPVIDEDAKQSIQVHLETLRQTARLIAQSPLSSECARGAFVAPSAFEIETLDCLKDEVFGPVLHVMRYRRAELDRVIDELNATGYALTLGVHSRLDSVAEYVFSRTRAGNVYVNRNMIGAMVGMQPFGGQGLSGTGPKAGGPNYLTRFSVERTWSNDLTAKGGNAALLALES